MKGKLVRDGLYEALKRDGAIVRSLSGDELNRALRYKLVEEAREAARADSRYFREKLIEEMADIAEVLSALRDREGINFEEVDLARAQKHSQRGGFREGVFWEWDEFEYDHCHSPGCTRRTPKMDSEPGWVTVQFQEATKPMQVRFYCPVHGYDAVTGEALPCQALVERARRNS